MPRAPLIVIFGPTAVGKTAFIEDLFSKLGNIEIINADSMQVYRWLDIGTAKPALQLRRRIPHHLIDILEPTCQFNAGEFVRRADQLVPEIRRRCNTPVLCGGTAYYLRSFITGLPDSPPGDLEIRRKLRSEVAQRGLEALLEELGSVDPVTRARLQERDSYRILRALEVYRSSGKPLSSFVNPTGPRRDYDFLLLGLMRDRTELYTRIEQRVEHMFGEGLVEEVRSLLARGYGFEDPGMRGIGYREFFELRKGCAALETVKELIKRNSRRYAKRQITFFKSLSDVHWEDPRAGDSVADLITDFLAGSRDLETGGAS
ncbi:MAG: tRNA (adenosine(37)-N6)-dimethylallyltransferase MiaA [Spirochaetaceae bacterium]|nr:MAG: tRNA (adenosine(37)-N6)-dimethylallyltransferase MiaA [Spirochaetaceae bacterium]